MGLPEHNALARPGSTPCAESINWKRRSADPSSNAAATRAAPWSCVSACPLSQRMAPPAGGRGGAQKLQGLRALGIQTGGFPALSPSLMTRSRRSRGPAPSRQSNASSTSRVWPTVRPRGLSMAVRAAATCSPSPAPTLTWGGTIQYPAGIVKSHPCCPWVRMSVKT